MKSLRFAILIGAALSLAACGEDPPKPYSLSPQETLVATSGARETAERTQSTFVNCSGQDSPPVDGYVTCETKLTAAPHTPQEWLCSYKGQPGCKRKT